MTPEERRALFLATLTAAASSFVGGLVAWAFEVAKERVRKAASPSPEEPRS